MKKLFIPAICLAICIPILSCSSDKTEEEQKPQLPLFTSLKAGETGISFNNVIEEDADHNCFRFEYIYNGGGIGAADFNNDGVTDLFFSGNQVANKLYLNKGGFKFDDVTEASGTAAQDRWCNGVTTVDINLDGMMDIYVSCAATEMYKINPRNLLYINNGDMTFTESAAAYGLDDPGFSMHSSFFDYDGDGDLDCYVMNRPDDFHQTWAAKEVLWKDPPYISSNRLYRNDGGKFTDVTKQAGLVDHSFSLGLITTDLTGDGWPDIYVANDYEEPDHFYEYVGNGQFVDRLTTHFRHISNFGMGSDAGDINNDGLPDLLTVDMVAKDNYRQKTMMSAMNPKQFWASVDMGFHYQYMRNTLQLNRGGGLFSEVGQLSGISNTDWSWAPLFADFDNDGWKDLIVTNGYRRDARNADMRKKIEEANKLAPGGHAPDKLMKLLNEIPVNKIKNYYFRNKGDLTFEDLSDTSGFALQSFSNGAVYADLDNDGDLDVVVSNLLDPAFVMKNNTIENGGTNYLKVKFLGPKSNPLGFGTKVTLKVGDQVQYREMHPVRGYLSSMEPIIHFGLGKVSSINQVEITWRDGKRQVLSNVGTNKVLTVNYNDAKTSTESIAAQKTVNLFAGVTGEGAIDWRHEENYFDDYAREVLLPHRMSQFGPFIGTGDVNADGLDDFYISGANGNAGELFVQQADGTFKESVGGPWDADKAKEDLGSLFFDADGDGDKDLYVVSGGNEADLKSGNYQDRLYINNGSGSFTKSTTALPKMDASGQCVVNADYDGDGDQDLFVGGRQYPGKYPYPGRSYILRNDGGTFTDVTEEIAPDAVEPGMVTDAVWADFNGDKQLDLVLVGEWMAPVMLRNDNGNFKNVASEYGVDKKTGWWFSITQSDVNKDGKPDFLLGNLGLNYKYQATETEPFHVYGADFDENGQSDIVLGYFNDGTVYPLRGRQCSSEQIPDIKKKFKSYEEFGKATLSDVYGSGLDAALHYEVREFGSCIMLSTASGYEIKRLPVDAQFSPINDAQTGDLNNDGNMDFVVVGNLFVSEVETGRADAGFGLVLLGDGKGGFECLSPIQNGFFAGEDAKSVAWLKSSGGKSKVVVGNNRGPIQLYDFIGGGSFLP